jgi:hypothetical protein
MENYIESFIAYFYDGDILTDDGVDLYPICGDYLIEETDGASMVCFDVENDAVKMLEGKICKTIIKTMDGKEHVFDRSKIETFKIEYNEENLNAGLVLRYGGIPRFRIIKL